MVDKNNLNRVKGILSAKQGTEIPKYNTGAKFTKQKGSGLIYSNDGSTWFTDPDLTFRYLGSLNGFMDVSTADMQIPGAVNITPTTAVENSAKKMEQQLEEEVTTTPKSADKKKFEELPGLGESIEDVQNKVTKSLNTVAPLNITPDKVSAGMNFVKKETDRKENLKQTLSTADNIAAQAFNTIGNVAAGKQIMTDSDTTKTADALYTGVSDMANKFGPVGKAVSSIMGIAKGTGDIIQELGGGTDQQTTTDKWMDSAFFSWNIGMLNGFAGKNTDSFAVDQDTIAKVGSSYGGTIDDLNDAASKAGKKYGLFSSKARKKANAAIANAKSQQNLMGNIADTAEDQRLAVQSMGEQAGLAYSLMTDGGYNQKYTYAAKHGGMLEWNPVSTLEWEPQVELNWELSAFKAGGNIELVKELEWVPEFKNGGKTEDSDELEIEETTQKNVIPEGALHKNKHHMEHAEGLTKKGIPVIDDDGEQQAEIEHSEIIFTLEVTKKLEEYYKIFYSDDSTNKEKEQAALDAGKLLVYQILENTEDRTGLIESCKKGGTITLKKTTDDLIDEVLEWAPTIVVVEETEVVEKPKKESEKKSETEIIKEAIKEVLIELLTK